MSSIAMVKTVTFIPQVAVLIPLTLKGHFDVFEGILRYVRLHGPWRLYRMEGRPGEQKLLDLKRWGCSGIITGPSTPAEAALIALAHVPVAVFEPSPEMLSRAHLLANHPHLILDSYAVGQQAGLFFQERHYTRFAFVGEAHGLFWSQERGQGFRDTVETSGATCAMYPGPNAEERRESHLAFLFRKRFEQSMSHYRAATQSNLRT